jgi:hypothetical protein
MDAAVKTPLLAALGAGFYRYWHVPALDGSVDPADARRADRSLVGPAALTALGAGLWAAGRGGAALHLQASVTMPLDVLPLPARLLVYSAGVALCLALVWWVRTAPLRARVARGLATGRVARLPDDAPPAAEPLHAAATQLGRALRELAETDGRDGLSPMTPPLAAPAFDVLHEAAVVLTRHPQHRSPAPGLRRRCQAMTQQLRAASVVNADRGPERNVAVA